MNPRATLTGEVIAIRAAAASLGTFNLQGCSMYTTIEPDVMSLGAILWSRIGRLFFGVSQQARLCQNLEACTIRNMIGSFAGDVTPSPNGAI